MLVGGGGNRWLVVGVGCNQTDIFVAPLGPYSGSDTAFSPNLLTANHLLLRKLPGQIKALKGT
ncbi:hypothetical protein C5167_039404 [Papaver somniferum]|uniref:Uncharacterized protein n=1 Tax=Papaver somniferum TaxID=3469 RepID=A0A4Y7IEI0_PAPSO|nr:hypothetical protein C5167_039404 [Papaver somniferum]